MTSIKRALGSALVIFVAVPPVLALAQSNGVAGDVTRPVAGVSATAGTLAPPEIVTEVRRAGFEPISRAVQRGPVYVLFALDDDMDVKLTVDARSGRVLSVTDVIGRPYGLPGYYGYHPLSRYERPPIPPGDIPNIGPGRNNSRLDRTNASVRRSPPLPRTRPVGLTSAVGKESAPPAQNATNAAAPGRSDVAPAAKSPPAPPTMVPVAPLE
jgi:hypothetical protein